MQTKTKAKLEDLRLSPRVYRVLYARHHIDYVDQVLDMTEEEMLFLQEIGEGAVAEIQEAIVAWRRTQ
jgi:DNA-directed RNA polymerase alpha subunit